MIQQHGNEGAEAVVEHHGVCDVGEADAEPVAPCHVESGIVAETGQGILIDTGVELGAFGGELSERVQQRQHGYGGYDPCHKARGETGLGADVLRDVENAGTDHHAENDGRQAPDAEPAQGHGS